MTISRLVVAARWLATGGPPTDDPVGTAALFLPPDDPAPGMELDASRSGAVLRLADEAPRSIDLEDEELAAVRHGLSLLREVSAASELLSRLPVLGSELPAGSDGADEDERSDVRVTLRVAPSLAAWLAARDVEGVERDRDGSARLGVAASSLDDLFPWLLRLGPRVGVTGPNNVRVAMAEAAARLAERYRAGPPEIPPPPTR